MPFIATEKDHQTTIKEVLTMESQAIINLVKFVNQDMENVVDMILECKGRVIVTGVGKSGIIARKITATLASTGTPSLFLHPSEGLHGDLGMVTNSDIVIALSKSGETEEIKNIIPSIKRIGAKLIAFVSNASSTLAIKADEILCIGDVKEACPLGLAPTTSTTLMLTLGDAIAIALLKARNFSSEDFAIYHPGGTLGKKLLLTVNNIIEITNKNPVLLYKKSIKEAIFSMTKSGLGAISIVDENGRLIGIITDGDIRRALGKQQSFLDISVSNLFNKNPITVKKEALAVEALNIMETKKIDVLPVVNDLNEPISMIHLHDITRLGF
ncbi:KpsF/GutQ family sugar-phosphate isomerase [Lederbergia panacisoli]|uniref:KpsF/GutQ family sugar-phosphate isomerase n=1 Tax=Lederbergia panacisoli TaxID=1255251 RepID=UPI00214CAEB8|nr:KpsF/GutQ family sugar-phosphate isomerase [Lederbergia panacisoli]MCR2822014.1 KpsF/GutQ family sugar-phosphate isomerase [Lederbergia panacisoli]